MTVHDLGRGELPEYQRPILNAHREFLREAYEFLASLPTDFLEADPPAVEKSVPYVLFVKLVQLGRVLHRLVETGYSDEAEPIARAMVSAGLNLVAIVDEDAPGRALRFVQHTQELRRGLLRAYVEEGYFAQEEADNREAKIRDDEERVLHRYAAKGVEPRALGRRPDTWHGLSDRELAERMNVRRWYNFYYKNFSDEAHVNVSAVARDLRRLYEERRVHVGPKHLDPWMVLFASAESIGECLGQLDTHFGLGRREETDAINERMAQALREHRSHMPLES